MSQSSSITEYFYKPEGHEGHHCGYCGSDGTSLSRGMWTHHLTCEDYQGLVDRGWRRSGKYCYKPDMSKTCCPAYTIRCRVADFRLSKSQKKVLKTMNAFLLHGERGKSKKAVSSDANASAPSGDGASAKPPKVVRPGQGPDPSKPPCQKAKAMRKERRMRKLAASSTDERIGNDMPTPVAVSSADLAAPPSKSGRGQSETSYSALSITSSSTPSRGRRGQDEGLSSIPGLFQDVGPDGKKPIEMFLHLPTSDAPPAHRLDLEWIRSSPPSDRFKATFNSSHALYQKYQMAIHGDSIEKCDNNQFRRFLCDSPLIPVKGEQGWPCDYGSYHQHYTLDGQLVMVAVVDILPNCLSSVYVFCDPDFSFLTLGVYSALREIETTRRFFRSNPAFEFYYMGYYIHSCQKMRYKGNYFSSSLLCPEAYRFVPIELCRTKLEARKYSRLLDESGEEEEAAPTCDNVMVLFQRQRMPYVFFRALCGTAQEPKVSEYAKLVGPSVASRMLLYLTSEVKW